MKLIATIVTIETLNPTQKPNSSISVQRDA